MIRVFTIFMSPPQQGQASGGRGLMKANALFLAKKGDRFI
jgi:hypothetical protein